MTGFLDDIAGARPLQLPDGSPLGFTPLDYHLGLGSPSLEVAVVHAASRPNQGDMRKLWKARQGGKPSPLLLIALYGGASGEQAALCGPTGDPPTYLCDLDPRNVERIAAEALAEANRHAAVRFLVDVLGEIESELPGLRNEGLMATHHLRTGIPIRGDWAAACEQGRGLLDKRGRDLVETLGFSVQTRDTTTYTLRAGEGETAAAIAIFLDESESFEGAGKRFDGNSPVSLALARADADRLPFVVVTRGSQIRLYVADKNIVGVGRKGRTETFLEVHLALLPAESAGYLPLLFGAEALLPNGAFQEILERSKDYASELSKRLRERVYGEVVPQLATAIARRAAARQTLTDSNLRFIYEQALFVLFRLVFIAYAEDKDLLPYGTNADYRDHALKTRAQRLAEHLNDKGELVFDAQATDLWTDVTQLFRAVDRGNSEWDVPAYDGGLFSADERVSRVGAAIERLELTNAEFGPALTALLVDTTEDDTYGAIDFRSLSVREFGTIYEGLLESNLSIAQSDLMLDKAGTYVPATEGAEVVVAAGEVYLHNQSGARKASGSYFTKEFAVEHLLDHALEPALDEHIDRLTELLEAGDEAAAAKAFFDFRVADIAMGSGHFLINCVDHIEARLTSFLTEHPLPAVNAEIATLRRTALERLGVDSAEGVEIEQAALIRRQVARRCIYGVDVNPVAVELARLALWIHTFVPGLPLSFLDRTLVCGNSLTGIGTLDEVVAAVEDVRDSKGTFSFARDQMVGYLEQARGPLERVGRISDATPADIEDARVAQAEAAAAVAPATTLFDLIAAARLGYIEALLELSPETVESHPGRQLARELNERLGSLHFPTTFAEVFLRDPPGFDCIVGNPPWEEATVEELGFWALRYPGLKSMRAAEQKAAIADLRGRRSDLIEEYEKHLAEAEEQRRLLLVGPYPGMGQGDPDLYKAFCWRFWQLARDGGRIGVVLPRSALSASGSAPWRDVILDDGVFADVTTMTNRGGWVFDDAEHRYTIGLVSILKSPADTATVSLIGPFHSLDSYLAAAHAPRVEFPAADFKDWSSGAAFPLLPSVESGEVFLKLRRHPRLDAEGHGWRARAVRELDATNDKRHMIIGPESTDGLWPVYKGASFDLWQPDTGEYYAWADPDYVCDVLQQKRLNQSRLARSVFSELPRELITDPFTLPCRSPRIAFRDVARATDSRTVHCALVPPDLVITNKGPYFVWSKGDERDQAYLLGMLASLPLDWYARRWVEVNLNFHILYAFPIPRPMRDEFLWSRAVEISGRLAAVDDRYADWAAAVGVPVGSVTDSAEKDDMIAELDAAVALLYGLDERDVVHIFETFHVGWDYSTRLDAVLAHYRRLRSAT